MVDLRGYVFLDSLQPQFASYQATIARGYLPKVGQASLFVEVDPGMTINQILDVALKATDVTAGMQIVERHYGMMEVHSESQADVRQAGQAVLDYLGLEESQRHKPRVVANQVVRHLEDTQTMLINRFRYGNMILAGQTLFVAGAKGDWSHSDDVFEGRKGVTLVAFSAGDGKAVAEVPLDAFPVFDGMSAAYGKLFVSDDSGTITCFE